MAGSACGRVGVWQGQRVTGSACNPFTPVNLELPFFAGCTGEIHSERTSNVLESYEVLFHHMLKSWH